MFSLEEHTEAMFLVGSCRTTKDHLQWVLTNRLYNVRSKADLFVARKGGLDSYLLPRYILLYDAGVFREIHLYECIGVVQHSQKEMEDLHYPAPTGMYVTYKLGNEHLIPSLNIKKLLQSFQKPNSKKIDYSPRFIQGKELIKYMKRQRKQVNSFDLQTPLRVGTLFSGIGAFEEALKQLGVLHEIKFACDTGEIELIPIDDEKNRRIYKDLNRRVRSLTPEEKVLHKQFKDLIARRNEEIREYCYNLPTKEERTRYVNQLYQHYEGNRRNYVRESYLANYDIAPSDFHTDIRFMRGDDYAEQVDILVGGSPCQSFSTYGKKQGLEDARGTLFYDYARIIKETSPKVFIYENVAAIKTNDNGHTWETMLSVWESLGYKIYPEILNAVDYDHPQLRRRVFIVGIREDICTIPYKFPEKKKLTKKSTDFLEKGPIPLKYYLGKGGFEWITTYEKNKRRSRVNQDIIGCQTANQQDNWIGDFRVERPRQEHYTDERIYIGKYDFGNGMEDAVGRKLTPRECLRLMGFSNKFRIVVDDHQAYHQSGNSIVVPVLKELILTLLPYLK